MILSVENISKSFGVTDVLTEINFELNKGEFFSVVGPSGCGKTTLLRIIAGLEVPSSGKILIEGIDSTNFPPQKRNTGIVFQNYALFPNMDVFGNVAYGLMVRKFPADVIERKVNEVLEKVRLSHKSKTNVTMLSGGEQQRVSLARVIVTEPLLLLFDEPLSNLDYALRLEARNEIKRLQKEIGITSVYVTHDQSEALALSDRILVLNKGVIQQTGTPQDVYFNPSNLFVAGFIGHSNFFDRKSSLQIFGIDDVNDDEFLCVFPEEVIVSKSENNCNATITDIQFTGAITELMLESYGKEIKSIIHNTVRSEFFREGEKIIITCSGKRRIAIK